MSRRTPRGRKGKHSAGPSVFHKDRRAWMREIASETMEIAELGHYTGEGGSLVDVSAPLHEAIANSVHYHHSHVFAPPKKDPEKVETQFSLVNCGAIEAALDCEGEHVGILNFASGKNPGGGFLRGSLAQEECLCRSSMLYPCLKQFQGKDDFYYAINSMPEHRALYTDCAIFSPRVPVIRSDSPGLPLLDEMRLCSFVTIPAPNTKAFMKQHHPGKSASELQDQANQVLRGRVFRALSIFSEQGCTDLVLGAFGCGVFGNDPAVVAKMFDDLLRADFCGKFRRVVFAVLVLGDPLKDSNFGAFASQLQKSGSSIRK